MSSKSGVGLQSRCPCTEGISSEGRCAPHISHAHVATCHVDRSHVRRSAVYSRLQPRQFGPWLPRSPWLQRMFLLLFRLLFPLRHACWCMLGHALALFTWCMLLPCPLLVSLLSSCAIVGTRSLQQLASSPFRSALRLASLPILVQHQ